MLQSCISAACLLASHAQLESQRQYFETLLARHRAEADAEVEAAGAAAATAREAAAAADAAAAEAERRRRQAESKLVCDGDEGGS